MLGRGRLLAFLALVMAALMLGVVMIVVMVTIGGAGGGFGALEIANALCATATPAAPQPTTVTPPASPATVSPAHSSPHPTPASATPAALPRVADIPPYYLRLYRAAGARYGIDWSVLAAIGSQESDHGRGPGPGIRSGDNGYGAAGPMQIGIGGAATNNWGGAPRHPAREHTGGVGVDGNGDGWVDVYDAADAIPGAAIFLRRHRAPADMRGAVYAYNHDGAYVDAVFGKARRYAAASQAAGLPAPSVGDTTGLGTAPPSCPPALASALGLIPAPAGAAGPASLPPGTPANVRAVIGYARTALGTPYSFGGSCVPPFATSQQRCDCSSLVQKSFEQVGVHLPRTADDQVRWGKAHGTIIAFGREAPGDVIAYASYLGPSVIGHIAIVIDGAHHQIIEAPATGLPVRTRSYTADVHKPLFIILRLLPAAGPSPTP